MTTEEFEQANASERGRREQIVHNASRLAETLIPKMVGDLVDKGIQPTEITIDVTIRSPLLHFEGGGLVRRITWQPDARPAIDGDHGAGDCLAGVDKKPSAR